MGKLQQMAGSPWHVEKITRQENDSRRHRSRCIYYNVKTKHCSYRFGKCIGSAHCLYYKEDDVPEQIIIAEKILKNFKSKDEERLRKLNTKVIHQKYGSGKVVNADLTHTTICFESGKEIKFSISMCIEKKFLSFENISTETGD